jgi:anti-sigma-K factor RskA
MSADHLAAEYALGVLDADERDRARGRTDRDLAFARQVADWEDRLAPLAAEVAPVRPAARVWPRIERALRPAAARLTRQLTIWRGLAAASLVMAVALAAIPRPPPPTLAALVASQTDEAVVVASLDRARGELILTTVAIRAPDGRSAELWLIPEGGTPASLGVIGQAQRRLSFEGRPVLAEAVGGVLAISLEPKGGSPTGAPTGPVVATGGFV